MISTVKVLVGCGHIQYIRLEDGDELKSLIKGKNVLDGAKSM